VPDDRVLPKEEQRNSLKEENGRETKTRKKRRKKVPRQVLVGVKLYRSQADGDLRVHVATRSVSLMSLDTDQGSWTQYEHWFDLRAFEHKSVHKLEWVKKDVMQSFHVASLLWWNFHL